MDCEIIPVRDEACSWGVNLHILSWGWLKGESEVGAVIAWAIGLATAWDAGGKGSEAAAGWWWDSRRSCQSHLRLVAGAGRSVRARQSYVCWGQQWWRPWHRPWYGAQPACDAGANVQSSHWMCWHMDTEGGDPCAGVARDQDQGACHEACVGLSGNGLPKASAA